MAGFGANVHVKSIPQSKDKSPPPQIISPQANKPVVGIVQDTLCGIRKFTLRDAFLDWTQVQNILLWAPDWNGGIPIPQ